MELKSPKEIQVEEKITALVTKIVDEQTFDDDLPLRLWNYLQSNQEIAAIQDYANIVSIGRLGLNDHGPVHMKIVCRNALKMLNIIHAVGVKTSLEKENVGSFADSVAAVECEVVRAVVRSYVEELAVLFLREVLRKVEVQR